MGFERKWGWGNWRLWIEDEVFLRGFEKKGEDDVFFVGGEL